MLDEQYHADDGQVPQRLVQEARVVGGEVFETHGPVGGIDVDGPGNGGWSSVELLVEPMPAPNGMGEGERGRALCGHWNRHAARHLHRLRHRRGLQRGADCPIEHDLFRFYDLLP